MTMPNAARGGCLLQALQFAHQSQENATRTCVRPNLEVRQVRGLLLGPVRHTHAPPDNSDCPVYGTAIFGYKAAGATNRSEESEVVIAVRDMKAARVSQRISELTLERLQSSGKRGPWRIIKSENVQGRLPTWIAR